MPDQTIASSVNSKQRRRQPIGVMQGRLSERPPGKLQAFPWRSYREEFTAAAKLAFDSLEWIFELDGFEANPLWTEAGRAEIRGLIQASGVRVDSICADYFMLRRLAGEPQDALAESRAVLCRLIAHANEIGASRILIPLLESSAVDTPELQREVVESLQLAAPVAELHGVTLGLELEIAGHAYAELVGRVASPSVRAYYDTGNSTARGFDIARDVEPLLESLHAVHIKDRVVGGSSQPLGEGAANFRGFFEVLARAGFRGGFVLQHYFDTDPLEAARRSLRFVEAELERTNAEAA
jgi:hexulose-6-phosphate isomerase